MKLAFLILAVLVVVGAAAYLLITGDREKASTARRLKLLGAPPTTKALADPLHGMPKGEPWLPYIPERYRERVNDTLGSTGYAVQLKTLLLISLVSGVVMFVGALLLGLPLQIDLVVLLLAAFGVPWLVLRYLQKRHIKRFLALFPDAIDLIVRAVRAGLPVVGALDATGRETPDPVGLEFRLITADMRIGLDLDEALHRANGRVRLADFAFFVASLILQRESGGNLSETLSILSAVLRRRAELRLKITAMTSEATTSAYVITSLPFVASGALALLNPSYISTFAVDPKGPYIVGAAAAMLMLGWLTMQTLIANATR